MSLITFISVSLTFGRRQIFNEIGFQVGPGDRIGLVGPNGSGKSSLLRLLHGEIEPDSGEIRIAKGTRIGYLPQDVQETLSGPLLPSVIDAIPGREALRSELSALQQSLNSAPDKADQAILAERLAEIHQELHHLDLEFPQHQAESILVGLGFKVSDFDRPVSTLSGGWKMRAALASLLYQVPDLLLLDEPTNHLDIPSIRWLEQFLQDFRAAIIVVSHDREFLNRQVHRVIGFEPEGMRAYSGNYDRYLQAREEERRLLEAKARTQEQKVKAARQFIDRFKAKASKARQAQSKIKLVKKLELIETLQKEKTIRFRFPDVPRSGREVVTLRGLSKAFDGNVLYKGINLTVLRGDRIAIIGPNGCGKTTLLNMIAGERAPDRGTIRLGHGVGMGYFAQHHSDVLDPRKTVLEEVYQVVPNETVGFVRAVLGAFLFSGEDVDKPINVLSGGERARVSLAKLLVKPGNLMVMDEPTNHLDISSSEKLIDALAQFTGTLLFVSHNQSFINRLASKIWDITGAGITEYPGNLDEYYDHLAGGETSHGAREGATDASQGKPTDEAKGSAPGVSQSKRPSRKAQKRERAERRQLIQKTLTPIMAQLERLEKRISDLEARQKELEKSLADPDLFKDKERGVPLLNDYNRGRKKLEELLLRWEQAQIRLESEKKNLGI
jgi:ATP-binding cassette subfamily F protein 3